MLTFAAVQSVCALVWSTSMHNGVLFIPAPFLFFFLKFQITNNDHLAARLQPCFGLVRVGRILKPHTFLFGHCGFGHGSSQEQLLIHTISTHQPCLKRPFQADSDAESCLSALWFYTHQINWALGWTVPRSRPRPRGGENTLNQYLTTKSCHSLAIRSTVIIWTLQDRKSVV